MKAVYGLLHLPLAMLAWRNNSVLGSVCLCTKSASKDKNVRHFDKDCTLSLATYEYRYRQTSIFRHSFFQKTVFSLKYSLESPLSKLLEVCLNSEYM
jgi:hypothetical protein